MLLDETIRHLTFDLYGGAFFTLGVAALILGGQESSVFFFSRHLRWLAPFGMIHGLSGFLAGMATSGASDLLGWAIIMLRCVAFIALFEFGRRLWNDGAPGRVIRLRAEWLYSVLAALLAGIMATSGDLQSTADAAVRYAFSFPSASLVGAAILGELGAEHEQVHQLRLHGWLRLLGVTFIVFGVLSLFLVLELPQLNWLPTNQNFTAVTGFPIQLPNTICALLIAFAYVLIVRRSATWTFNLNVHAAALVTNEEKFRTLFEMSSDAILTFDRDRIIEANQSCVHMLGFESREALIGKNLLDISPARQSGGRLSRDAVVEHVRLANAKGTHLFEWTHERADGTLFETETRLTPMPTLGEGLMQAIIRDVSVLKATTHELQMHREHLQELVLARTEEMQVAKNVAEKASAAKSDFLARMSHEFRTPLNAILGFGQLLQLELQDGKRPGMNEYVNQIVRAGDHLLRLVNELLDLSRIESGHLQLKLEPLNVVQIIDQCIRQLSPLVDGRHIEIHHRKSGDFVVLGDVTRLTQVALNLLSNAVKYNRQSGQIYVEYHAVAPDRVRVEIRDTGAGLTPEEVGRLFQLFERLRKDSSNIEGTGIGLALSKHLIEAMQGTIGATSLEGTGSTFWFELPLAVGAAPAIGVDPQPSTPEKSGSQRCKLLYIEDSRASFQLVEHFLEKQPSFSLLGAGTGQRGFDLAVSERPDAILLDIDLPDMDGYAVLERLRADPRTRSIPVLAITASAMPDDVEFGMAVGFSAYLAKPLDLAKLLDEIKRVLR